MNKIQAKKSLSQNFLQDAQVIHNIVKLVPSIENTMLVEIGPGLGAITKQLVQLNLPLTAIELDHRIIPILTEKFRQHENFEIIHENILDFDLDSFKKENKKFIIIGNLPYHISTPIMFHLFQYATLIDRMIFMMQKEMVQRIAAKVDTKKYGRLTVMAQYYASIEQSFIIPSSAFSPAPKVDSQMIILKPHHTKPFIANNESLFAALVKEAFNYRRKTLRNALKKKFDVSKLEHKFALEKRPENFSLHEFIEMANLF